MFRRRRGGGGGEVLYLYTTTNGAMLRSYKLRRGPRKLERKKQQV